MTIQIGQKFTTIGTRDMLCLDRGKGVIRTLLGAGSSRHMVTFPESECVAVVKVERVEEY